VYARSFRDTPTWRGASFSSRHGEPFFTDDLRDSLPRDADASGDFGLIQVRRLRDERDHALSRKGHGPDLGRKGKTLVATSVSISLFIDKTQGLARIRHGGRILCM
jgi:hypothetical protein